MSFKACTNAHNGKIFETEFRDEKSFVSSVSSFRAKAGQVENKVLVRKDFDIN